MTGLFFSFLLPLPFIIDSLYLRNPRYRQYFHADPAKINLNHTVSSSKFNLSFTEFVRTFPHTGKNSERASSHDRTENSRRYNIQTTRTNKISADDQHYRAIGEISLDPHRLLLRTEQSFRLVMQTHQLQARGLDHSGVFSLCFVRVDKLGDLVAHFQLRKNIPLVLIS